MTETVQLNNVSCIGFITRKVRLYLIFAIPARQPFTSTGILSCVLDLASVEVTVRQEDNGFQ